MEKDLAYFIGQQQEFSQKNEKDTLEYLRNQVDRSNKIINEVSEIIQTSICDHQRFIIEFIIRLADLSYDLKGRRSLIKLERGLSDLFIYFRQSSIDICTNSGNKLEQYFQLDGRHPPRFIVKGLRQSDKHIIDYYRHNCDALPATYSFEAKENTAFQRVNKDQKFYFSNNIPEEAKSTVPTKKYINKRLIKDEVENYNLCLVDKNLKYNSHEKYASELRDTSWEKCWLGYDETLPSYRSFYKSTLVIPISISHIDIQTKQSLSIDGNYDRAIFGYLCFDDVCAEYFNFPMDRSVGYVFSKILSLYNVAMKYFEKKILSKEIAFLNSQKPDWKEIIWKNYSRIDR